MATYVRLSFTNEEEKRLIGFIEQHPALWDAASVEYSNVRLRQDYWQRIAQLLNKSETDCRRKWRFIRDYYLHKRKLKTGPCDTADSKYQNLIFLRKIITQRAQNAKRIAKRQPLICKEEPTSEENETLPKIEEEHVEETSDSDFDTISIDLSNRKEDHTQDDKDEHELLTDILYDDEDMTCSPADVPCVEEKLESSHDSAQSTSNRVLDAAHEKAIDLFFVGMAATVKTFPPHIVAQAKAKVFQAISELEFQLHKQVP